MQPPLEIIVHRTTLGPQDMAMIRRCARRLTGDFGRLQGCRLAVDAPWPRRGAHPRFTAQVDLTLPTGVISVAHPASEDRFVVIQEALDAAARQLQAYAVHHRYHVN